MLFVIAGEASGDMVGQEIIRGLSKKFPKLCYSGIGGPYMEKEGNFTSIVPFSTFSHLGLGYVIKNLPTLLRILNFTVKEIYHQKPVGLLTIDCPEFCLRVSRRIKSIPRIHCIAPAVWAWRPNRAKVLQNSTDLLLSLFPFEAPYFSHMPYAFVGHPVFNRPTGCADQFWFSYGNGAKRPLLCLLPGSREREIRQFLPVFLETTKRIQKECPGVHVVITTTPTMRDLVQTYTSEFPIIQDEQEKSNAFAATTVALAASGTVSLELAFHGTPMIIGYQVPKFTGWILRRLLSVSSVALINIVGKADGLDAFVPECLQKDFNADVLSHETLELLTNFDKREYQKKQSLKAIKPLKGTAPFGELCANIIGSFLKF